MSERLVTVWTVDLETYGGAGLADAMIAIGHHAIARGGGDPVEERRVARYGMAAIIALDGRDRALERARHPQARAEADDE